ncbi:RNA polymerase subunit sigma-24 [Neorhizobium sp. P12A]|uniref:sigma-70 family RNA polymerase sigma factor n=1 Tax=Neorhizobium sp. P12A TaxID=2268027 RepID=UPI0011EF848B|nr:sigma-70 family RNA polymerase sigma factor [Neorhizobium sp. P12A]KAA0700892.1 RNA polymerase subunit sigma-24 [Neorhizobium sp. P12A]
MTNAPLAYSTSFTHRPFLAFFGDLGAATSRFARSVLNDGPARALSTFRETILAILDTTADTDIGERARAEAGNGADEADVMRRFRQTIVPHMDAAYNFARFLSRDQDAAQDILQDAFLRACRSFGGYRGGDPRAWIFSIVRNCYHAWLIEKRRKSRVEIPMPGQTEADGERSSDFEVASEEDTPEMSMIHTTESLRVRKVISALPEAMREVLVLRELEDLSYRQIAEIVDVPIGTVMSRLARARQEFADAWRLTEDNGKTK